MAQITPHYDDDGELIALDGKVDFILAQDQSFWLLYAEALDWDVDFDVASAMVDRPDTDTAIIAALFWRSGVTDALERPGLLERSLTGSILRNAEAGHYAETTLGLPRHVLAPDITRFLAAAKAHDGALPFRIPNRLFGPFEGQMATFEGTTDPESEALLRDHAGLDFDAAAKRHYWSDRNTNVLTHDLPDLYDGPPQQSLGMIPYARALYGDPAAYQAAQIREATPPEDDPARTDLRAVIIIGGIMLAVAVLAFSLITLRTL
ncbi:MAG: hypothetical protein ACU0DW_02000 [Shimia sp.]